MFFALPLLLLASLDVPPPPTRGAALYAADCASCHGVDQWGSANGPSLRGVGLGAVDFYLTTGRMPAAVPWLEVEHRSERTGQRLPLSDIRAIEAYLAPSVAGGPPIPTVIVGNVAHGRSLFAVNCEQCHGISGEGGDLGGLAWVPSLHNATINEVADAIRVGPEEMPPFGERQLSQDDLDDVAAYVMRLQDPLPVGEPPFRSTGPVPEGAVGYVAIIVLLAFVFTFWRSSTPAASREESVRTGEGEDTA